MKLVLVEWVDSSGYAGWHKLGDNDVVSPCVSVGILVSEDDKQLVLSPSRSDCGNVLDTLAIPVCSIKRSRTLKVKDIG